MVVDTAIASEIQAAEEFQAFFRRLSRLVSQRSTTGFASSFSIYSFRLAASGSTLWLISVSRALKSKVNGSRIFA